MYLGSVEEPKKDKTEDDFDRESDWLRSRELIAAGKVLTEEDLRKLREKFKDYEF